MPERWRGRRSPPRVHPLPVLQPWPRSPGDATAASAANGSANTTRPSPQTRTRAAPTSATPAQVSLTTSEQEGTPIGDLSFDRREAIERSSRLLANWDQLSTLAMSRSESIPQTRQYLLNLIMRASDTGHPFERPQARDGFAPRNVYVPRRHDPPSNTSAMRVPAESFNTTDGVLQDHRMVKKDSRRREEALARYFSHEQSSARVVGKSEDRNGKRIIKKLKGGKTGGQDGGQAGEEAGEQDAGPWEEIVGVAWEDLGEFKHFGRIVFPARESPPDDSWAVNPVTPDRQNYSGGPSAPTPTHNRQEES